MPAPTVLFIGTSIAAGYSPRGGKRALTVVPADASGDIGLSIEALLAAMPGRQRQVYVLSTEVWSQAVTVESRSLRRIDKAQIPQLMAFEAESLSGMSVVQARTALELIDAGPMETTYWISQIDSTRFAQASDAVAFNGGKLLGIAHPAGLPVSLGGFRSGWTRFERWDDLSIAITKQGRSSLERAFLSDSADRVDSPIAARNHLAGAAIDIAGKVEFLDATMIADVGDTIDMPDEPVENSYKLSRRNDFEKFLSSWAQTLRSPKSIPVIRPIRRTSTAQTKRTLALAATAAAIMGIALHYNFSKARDKQLVEELQQQLLTLQEPIEAFNQQQTELGNLATQLTTVQSQIDDLETKVMQYRGQIGIHRSRMARLLRMLSENRPGDIIISSASSDGNSVRLVGRSMRPEPIIDYASALAEKLRSINLTIQVPRREALMVTAQGAPYEFEYVILDAE